MRLSPNRQRIAARILHLAVAIPIGAVIYAPDAMALSIRPALQLVVFPLLALSGLWMWQGHRLGIGRRRPAADQQVRGARGP